MTILKGTGKTDREVGSQREAAIADLCSICHQAWQKNLMPGWSGNASVRVASRIIITAKGVPKGFLSSAKCLTVDMSGQVEAGQGEPSSEMALHLALYKRFPQCGAVLHSHPAFLQALELRLRNPDSFFALDLYEASVYRKKFHYAPPTPPGTRELGEKAAGAVSAGSTMPFGVWLGLHGLVVAGVTLSDCLCLTEELEHLAQTQLLSMD